MASAEAPSTANTVAARVNYSELNEAEEAVIIEIASNALKNTEKSERPMYHKDVAQLIKQQLDQTKGYDSMF